MTEEQPGNEDGNNGSEPPAEVNAATPEALRSEMEALQAKAAEYLEGWQRSRAEFANYKRRIEKDRSESYQDAAARAIARFLDVADDLDRALQERPADASDTAAMTRWADGVSLIQRKLQNILDAEGVERINAEGKTFDPQQHEAVTHEDGDGRAPGEVISVIRQGYRVGDRVIRPALVRVAK